MLDAKAARVNPLMIHKDAKFGKALQQLREECGLTQSGVAARTSFSQSYISQLESGKRRPPTRRVIQSISEALRLDQQEETILFESAGFLPLRRKNNSRAYHPDAASLFGWIVDHLTTTSPNSEVVFKDIAERIGRWDTYERAVRAAPNNPQLARELCTSVIAEEQASLLISRAMYLYSTVRDSFVSSGDKRRSAESAPGGIANEGIESAYASPRKS
jgi:transcriptional regulator with XRE-family HTH domain